MTADAFATLLLVGGVGIGAWYFDRWRERREQVATAVKEVTRVSDREKALVKFASQLPATLDPHRMRDLLLQDIDLFRKTPGLIDQYFLSLRSKYASKWERNILQDINATLKEQIELIDTGVEHQVKTQTIRHRIEAGRLQAETELFDTQVQHREAKARADGRVETARIKAENEALEEEARRAEIQARRARAQKEVRDLGPTERSSNATSEDERAEREAAARERERAEARADADLEAELAELRRRKAQADAETAKVKNPKKPPSAKERQRAKIQSLHGDLDLIRELKERMDAALEKLAADFGEKSDIYKRARNRFEREMIDILGEG